MNETKKDDDATIGVIIVSVLLLVFAAIGIFSTVLFIINHSFSHENSQPVSQYDINNTIDSEIDARVALDTDPFYINCKKKGGVYTPAQDPNGIYFYDGISELPTLKNSCVIITATTTYEK